MGRCWLSAMKHGLSVNLPRSGGMNPRVEQVVGRKRLPQFQTSLKSQSEAGGKPDCTLGYTELVESDALEG